MRSLLVALALGQVACGWSYEVSSVADSDVDSQVTEDSTVDSEPSQDSALEADASDTIPSSCPDAPPPDADAAEGGTVDRCTQCALNRCSMEAVACNADATCKSWLTCAGTCTCPRFPCYSKCREISPSMLADTLLACMAKECLGPCN